MKSRKETAEYINSGQCVKDSEHGKIRARRFGKIEIMNLMDFIYESNTPDDDECVVRLEVE